MIPSVFMETGAARKRHRFITWALSFLPHPLPSVAAYPWGYRTDSSVRNINITHTKDIPFRS